ncbi:MAG: hypothetical protein QF486_00465 [Candidatus Woesearchaeota archaeon]|nr:hypothetical protein [Candidatus Woesearchaeota archaeon]MDP7181304.1 hypothetical protein [Candidatus Woesearchaeota archaeon]MDP7198077.1 hypothetical protein [Candidatus Woesearchaeota archaeon]MDP7466911.1 hypothetical protein [Candidatus Woesearchaeota archaeon]MDP7647346.1 hypothetical protein [Candidatus Woesearchaeota archaeon]
MDAWKHKRKISGSDAERYIAQMCGLTLIPDGHRSPDLISTNGVFSPCLALEVKEGRGKGVLVDYPLHYGVTSEAEYVSFFGESPPDTQTVFGADRIGRSFSKEPTVVYYAVVDRKDRLKATDFKAPYASIRHDWGDIYLVPHAYAFYSFAVQHATRTGRTVPGVVPELKKMIKADMDSSVNPDYKGRKGDMHSFQNLILSDANFFITGNRKVLTRGGKNRVRRMERNYKTLPQLERRVIPGPNDTSIYALVEPDHASLFDALQTQIASQNGNLEEIIATRKASVPLLGRFVNVKVPPLFPDLGLEAAELVHNTLREEELLTLERVAQWMPC